MSEKIPKPPTPLSPEELDLIEKILAETKDIESVGGTPVADQSEKPLHTAQNSPTPDPTTQPRGPESAYPPRPPQGL